MTSVESPLGNIGLVAISLYVSDLEVAVSWYSDKLGLHPMSLGTDQHRFAAYSIGGAIVVLEPVEAALEALGPGSESTTLNVMVDRDLTEVRAELVSRGVPCGEVAASAHYGFFLVRDVDGNRFYISRPVSDEARSATAEAAATAGGPAPSD
ncbi:MAG TPA: VOC family protein [Acidimicrobiales bacterium]|nr:VOC family protein [Acidimicrobiales bacterium]